MHQSSAFKENFESVLSLRITFSQRSQQDVGSEWVEIFRTS